LISNFGEPIMSNSLINNFSQKAVNFDRDPLPDGLLNQRPIEHDLIPKKKPQQFSLLRPDLCIWFN